MKYTKALIVVHRDESTKDFEEIARRIRKLDPTIGVVMISEILTSKMIPSEFLRLPMLVIYLINPPPTKFKVATKIAVKEMSKIDEYAHFKKHNLPCLPIERFKWGMELDPSVYGDWVVLKPEHMQSTGKDVNMLPTKLIPTLKIEDFPAEHLIHQDSYLVQKFVKTGDTPNHFRVGVFLGKVLYSVHAKHNKKYPELTASIKDLLTQTVASNEYEHRTMSLIKNNQLNEVALRVSSTFPDNPLFGIDIIRDQETGNLFVLETNLGGNTWHFSSEMGHVGREQMGGRKAMVLQYNAWDRAAEALVRKVNEVAS